MKKSTILSILCGLVIVVTTIVMIFRLSFVADNYCAHVGEWSLDVYSATLFTSIIYATIIIVFTILLVIINIHKK